MKKLIIGICCLGGLAATNVGWAGLTTLSINSGFNVGTENVRQGTTSHNVYATAFMATRTGGALLPTGHPDPFLTFCLSIDGSLASPAGWTSGGFSDPLASDGLRKVDSLYRAANLYSGFGAGVLSLGLNTAAGKIEGAALQLAIWEVLYEKDTVGYSVTTSESAILGFQVTSGVAAVNTRANQMLATSWSTIDYSIETTFWNAVGGNQDLIGPMTPVPEPTTMIAGALLLLPFGASTLRILRKRRVA